MIDVIIEYVDCASPNIVFVIEYDIENKLELGLLDTCDKTIAYSEYNVIGERLNGETTFNNDEESDFDYEDYTGVDLEEE